MFFSGYLTLWGKQSRRRVYASIRRRRFIAHDDVANLTGESVDLTGQPVSRGVHNENLTKCSNLYTPDVLKLSLGGDPIGIL